MSPILRARLSLMMFLNYVVWGAWYVTLGTYLTSTLKFTGTQAGAVFGTTALACIISPFFMGLIADRFLSTERLLALVHIVGAGLLVAIAKTTSFPQMYALMLIYSICYFPTLALTNSLTLRNLRDIGGEFPLIRVFATIGWIAIGQTVGRMGIETTATPFLLAAGASIVMAIYSLTLPHTPPAATEGRTSFAKMLGLDALVMLKQPSYLVFVIASILACIPLTFYFSFTNAYLNDVGVTNAAGKMTWAQVSEVGMMVAMPFILRRLTLKSILILGLAAWAIRYTLLAYGDAGPGMWMFYIAILLHGICYDFFFMTGQLYTDQEAPPHLRSTAQGLIAFLTLGIGMFIGSLLSGTAVDYFSTEAGGKIVRNWQGFWLSSAAGSFAILLLLAVFFRDHSRIQQKAPDNAVAAD